MPADIPFARMNGIGNEILVADMRGRTKPLSADAIAALAADKRTRFDQLMAIGDPSPAGETQIAIFNRDGSPAGACGNGLRCVTAYLREQDGRDLFDFDVAGQRLTAEIGDDGIISVDMGAPRFGWREIPLSRPVEDTRSVDLAFGPAGAPLIPTCSMVSMSNPHAVFFTPDDPAEYDLERYGPELENDPIFPDRANISLARIDGPDAITMRTWERGAGLTLACGSGACAVLVSAARLGRTGRKAEMTLPGGMLGIDWREDDHVHMSGPVAWEFTGRLDPASGAFKTDKTDGEAA